MNETTNGLLLLGGGGHCKSVLCALLTAHNGGYDRIGIVDGTATSVLGVPAVGRDDALPALRAQGYTHAFVSVGSVGDTGIRRRLFALIEQNGFIIPNIIDATAAISPYATLGAGIFVGKNAVVNAGARIGDGAILNTGCIVEHDDSIGAFVHIAPGAVLGGNVTVGADAHIGSNATVLQGIQIGEKTIVGAGSAVTRDLPAGVVAYGNPCRKRKNL